VTNYYITFRYTYILDNNKIEITKHADLYSPIHKYVFIINDDEIECSYFLKRKIYMFLDKKWDEEVKEGKELTNYNSLKHLNDENY
jgi:hypothetical protein